MAGHLLSTTARIEAEEAAARTGADGWKPAGPPLMSEPNEAELNAAVDQYRPVIQYGPKQFETLEPCAIPSIGNIVVYHLRTGDSRNRRVKFPAIVMDGDPATGTLKLWVIVDDGDTWMQDNVPARVEPEPGWELVASGEMTWLSPSMMEKAIEAINARESAVSGTMRQRVDELERTTRVLGEGAGVPASIMTRLAALEDTVNALMTPRKVGRPPKPKE